MDERLIEVKNIVKLYIMGTEELYALKGVSLDIKKMNMLL